MNIYHYRQVNVKGHFNTAQPLILYAFAPSPVDADELVRQTYGINVDDPLDYCACCGGFRWPSQEDYADTVDWEMLRAEINCYYSDCGHLYEGFPYPIAFAHWNDPKYRHRFHLRTDEDYKECVAFLDRLCYDN